MSETPRDAQQICAALDQHHYVFVEREGARYLVTEDENGNGFYAWPAPSPTRVDDAHAVESFGESDWPDGVSILSGAAPDYTALSERIAEWLTGGAHAR